MYKRVLALAICIICTFFTQTDSYALSAQSAVLIDGHTGRVLMAQNAYQRLGMASTTKIMTALLAIESGKMDEMVTVSAKAASVEGSSMYLKSGEHIRLRDLVYGLMLNSGNDAAIAIAEYLGGDCDSFAAKMNEKVNAIGLKNTNFTNPHGLDNENHYTTAYDLAQITRHAYSYPEFAEIVSTKIKTIGNVAGEGEQVRTLCNHNRMLSSYKGANGVKTGFTKKCGRCLVSSATRDCLQLIAVTLNAGDDWNDHREMLDYGFSRYRWKIPVKNGDYMKTLPILGSNIDKLPVYANSNVELAVNESDNIKVVYDVPNFVEAPVKEGQCLGTVDVYLSDQKVNTVELVAKSNAEMTGGRKYKKTFLYLVSELFGLVGG